MLKTQPLRADEKERNGEERQGSFGVVKRNGSTLPLPHRTARLPYSTTPCALRYTVIQLVW